MGSNPEMMAQMAQSPLFQAALNQVTSNPEQFISQMEAMNPQMAAMMNAHPQMRQMMANPEFLRQAMNPQNLQAMMQMQSAMNQLRGSGLMPGYVCNPFACLLDNVCCAYCCPSLLAHTDSRASTWAVTLLHQAPPLELLTRLLPTRSQCSAASPALPRVPLVEQRARLLPTRSQCSAASPAQQAARRAHQPPPPATRKRSTRRS